MTPTNELRWAKRIENTPLNSGVEKTYPVLVLQQKWVLPNNCVQVGLTCRFEWRDVPTVDDAGESPKSDMEILYGGKK